MNKKFLFSAALAIAPNNDFSMNLYHSVQKENFVISPYSAETVLQMVALGAKGSTATQMQDVLGKSSNAKIPADKKNELRASNAVWIEKTFKPLDAFLKTLRSIFNSELHSTDFRKAPAVSRMQINDWVEKETEHKIKDLLKEGSVTTDTRMILTNTIFFRGQWAHVFEKRSTKLKDFYNSGTTKKKVPTMHQKEEFDYMETPTFQAVQLPYAGYDMSMLIILPKGKDKINQVAASINAKVLSEIDNKLKGRDVILSLPKFKIEFFTDLSSHLQALGIKDAFMPIKADFSGMTGNRELFLSNVSQKAFCEVDETGTVAAAATDAEMLAAGAPTEPPPPVKFQVDHPFMFLIRHVDIKTILFAGRVSKF